MTLAFLSVMPLANSVILGLSALGLLVYGVFQNKDALRKVSYGAMFVLLLVVFRSMLAGYAGTETLAFSDDTFTRLMSGSVCAVALAVIYGSYRFLKIDHLGRFEYPILMLLSVIGMMIMISSNNLLYFYMGLELQSLSIYILVAMNRDSGQVSESALKYFILGAVASVFILYGISFIYGGVGDVDFASIAANLQGGTESSLFLNVGLVFLLAGLAFKLSAAPFHMWTPDVYEGSTTPVTLFIASAPKVAAVAVVLRLMFGPFVFFQEQWMFVFQVLGMLSIIVGVFAALYQINLKRLLAYSTISHMGFVMLGISNGSFQGLYSAIVYILLYVVMAVGVFLTLVYLRRHGRHGPVELKDLKGLSTSHPLVAIALTVFLFSLAGIPPFSGFFAKFGVLMATIQAGHPVLAILAVLASVAGALYYLRLVKFIYFDTTETPLMMRSTGKYKETALIIGFCVAITGLYIFLPQTLLEPAYRAASVFLAP